MRLIITESHPVKVGIVPLEFRVEKSSMSCDGIIVWLIPDRKITTGHPVLPNPKWTVAKKLDALDLFFRICKRDTGEGHC